MADEADLAAVNQGFFLKVAMADRPNFDGESATECDACGAPIPVARRHAVPGCRLCVACQQEQELRS